MSYDLQRYLEAAMRYEVLGPVEAKLDDGRPVAVGGPQQRRLLALLLSRPGESVSGERLVDCLWPDGLAPVGAGRSVMTYVSRLRAALGDSSISTVQEGYRLELGDSTVDWQQFETLLSEAGTAEPGRAVEIYDRALALWRGGAYGDFGGEWWLLAEATRLNEMRVVAMEERAEALLSLGHHHRLIPELERLAADHPLRERPVSLLMQALFANGRHADALRVYQAFRTRLGDETGLDPSSELVALERSLASGQAVPNLGTRARLLRGYTVHEVLGEGAFGRVFAATQPGTNREVAIKAIRPDLANGPEFIQRFEAEAQLVARLEHPHIVPLYDYWREPGGAYLVFRLLLGGTAFAAMVNDGPFSIARVSRLVEEAGGALLAAHTAGVVHCDIKPSNVMFDEAGNTYLSDFGIAVTASMHRQSGDRTRAYAAPELAGRAGDTVRSDIFSFGCMLWELLAGVSPFGVMGQTYRSRLPSLAGSISEPSEALDAVLARATSADVETRYESMADLIIAWRDAVGRPEGVLTPVGSPSSRSPDSSRRRAVRALSTAVSTAVNPYKGLRAFTEADASDFFGRGDVATTLHQSVMARGFVTVVGPSGSGKSSLVHAGLVPLLRQGGVRVATIVPGDRPTVALREALRQVAATESDTNDPSELFREAVGDGAGEIVLVVDQFEECWTLADSTERERFLSALVVAGRFGVRCVTTVRADLYDRPLQHALIGQMVADGTFALPPLSPEALEEAVVRPADRHGVDFDDGVVTAIVAEANAQPAGLPLLQFAMAELYERRVDDRVTATTLHQLGGLGGAIGRRAEEIYTSLDEDMQAHTRQLFGRLVAPGHGTPDTRRRARFSELSEPDRIVADRFVLARLLVADRDLATREPVIEVAHESLLTNWPRLREWLDADRRWLAQLQHVATSTRAWEEAGRPDGELYRGSRLEAVIEALPEHGQQLSDDERAFIDASQTARDAVLERERRNARRLRRRLVATAGLLVLALIAGAIALTQRQQARTAATDARAAQRDAEIAALVGRTLSIRGTQRDTAALLSIEAFRLKDTQRTRSALFSTFTSDVGYLGTVRLPESLGSSTQGIVLPDGKTALVRGLNDQIRSYDLDTRSLGEPWPTMIGAEGAGASHFVSSADGTLLAQIFWYYEGDPTALVVFDTTTHEPVFGPLKLSLWVDNAVFSPDAQRVYLSGGPTGTVVAYSVPDGAEAGRLEGLPPPSDSVLGATTAGLAFVAGGLLAVGSVAGPIRLVDPLSLTVVSTIDAPRGYSERLQTIDDGKTLIGAGFFGQARFDVADPSRVPIWQVGASGLRNFSCGQFAVAEKLGRYYCADEWGRLEERDLATGGLIRELSSQNGNTNSIWLAKDETELVSFSESEPLLARWLLDGSGPISRRVGAGAAPGSYSPDGRFLLADFAVDRVLPQTEWGVLDAETGEVLADSIGGLYFPEWRADGTLQGGVIDPVQGRVVATLDVRTMQIEPTNLTVDATPTQVFANTHRTWLFYAATDDPNGPGMIRTIDNDTNTWIDTTISVTGVDTISGSDSGDRLAVGGYEGVFVFDGNTGELLHKYTGGNVRAALVLAGNRLVTLTHGGKMTVYDLDSFEAVATMGGGRGFGSIQGSADGSVVVVTGEDRSVILYDVATGEQIGEVIAIPDTERVASALRPDGKELAVGGGGQGDFTVWDLDTENWITAACQVAGRNLTPLEWETHLGGLGEYHRTCPDYP